MAMPKALKAYWAKRRRPKSAHRRKARAAKRNYYSAGALANPRKRRTRRKATVKHIVNRRVTRRKTRRARSYRHNPPTARSVNLFGFQLPPLEAVAAVGAGFVAAPVVTSFVSGYIPDSIKANPVGQWALKIAGALGPGFAVRKFVSRSFGNNMLIGGGAALVLDAVRTFAPGMIPGLGYQPMLGAYYRPGQANRGLRGYTTSPNTGQPFQASAGSLQMSKILMGTPDRLQPTGRF
jgi:hypothetical protein